MASISDKNSSVYNSVTAIPRFIGSTLYSIGSAIHTLLGDEPAYRPQSIFPERQYVYVRRPIPGMGQPYPGWVDPSVNLVTRAAARTQGILESPPSQEEKEGREGPYQTCTEAVLNVLYILDVDGTILENNEENRLLVQQHREQRAAEDQD